MRTLSPEGPLDICRRVNDEAEGIDDLLIESQELDEADSGPIKEWINELEKQHPLIGQEVVVYGQVLTPSMGDNGVVHPLTTGVDKEGNAVEGKYCGYMVCTAYDPVLDESGDILAHMVKTSTESYADEFGNVITKDSFTYVWVWGSEVIPKLPLLAHSLEDLKDDEPVDEFDRLTLESAMPRAEVVRRIGSIANRLFINTEYDQAEMNQQRVSYLNSLGILDGIVLVTRDVLVMDRDDYIKGDNIRYSDMSNVLHLKPQAFDILPGYLRIPGGGIFPGGPPELFATCELVDGRSVLIPIKAVEEINDE